MHFLVVGIGSIGTRHIKNLHRLGVEVSVFDKNADIFQPHIGLPETTPQLSRLEELVHDYGVHYADPNNRHFHYDAWVICTPPASHMDYIVKGMQQFSHIFVEKPISNNRTYLDWVAQTARIKNIIVQVGYQLRYHPGLVLAKKLLDEGRIGKLLSIRAEFGQYLPDWHPGQDYKGLYASKDKEGGGIILEASHEIDYVRWLAGSDVVNVSCFSGKLSSLDIDVEDTAEINLQFQNGVIGNIHVDCVNRTYTRWCRLLGEEGSILWEYPQIDRIRWTLPKRSAMWKVPGHLAVVSPKGNEMLPYHLVDPYLEEMKDFIRCIKDNDKPKVDVNEGIKTLDIALAAKKGVECQLQ